MDIRRIVIWSLVLIIPLILLLGLYSVLASGYHIEEAEISRFVETEVAERFGLRKTQVLSAERVDSGRTAAFIFRLADSAGQEHHVAAAFRKSLVQTRYQVQDMFLIEDYLISEHSGILTAQDYLRNYHFDVRNFRLQLQAATSRVSGGALTVAGLTVIMVAAFLAVVNRGDQAGTREAVAAENAFEHKDDDRWQY